MLRPEKFKRSRRRRFMETLKRRMRMIGTSVMHADPQSVTQRWIAKMASTHGKPCSCYLCTRSRAYHGPPIGDRRRLDRELPDPQA